MKKKEEMRGEKKQHALLRAFLFFLIALLVYEIGRNKLHRRMGRRESRCRYAWLSWFSQRLPRWD